ncbi:MAG TPA: hypothetical protein VHT02_07775 [Methylocella sp.]|nr:hypothetical protein [Methylocella sp.]
MRKLAVRRRIRLRRLSLDIPRSLGIFGEPRVNVLDLNLDLEKSFPARETNKKPPVSEATPVPAPAAPVVAAPAPTAPPVVAAPAAPETPPPPVVAAPAAPETPPPPVIAAPVAPPVPEAPAAAPPPSNLPENPTSKPVVRAVGAAAAIFPSEISPAHAGEKPETARHKTCSDQYRANTATNSNGGLKWNAYWKECKKRMKG